MKASQFGLRESDFKSIVEILEKFDTITEAILFGSRAKGNFKRGSDVDIALKGDIDFRTIAQLSYKLNQESSMPYQFDLVNYSRTKHQELKDHIDRVGTLIYQKPLQISA